MSTSPFDATGGNEGEVFGFVDDGDNVEEPDERLESNILAQDDYREADKYGTTPEEARRGRPLDAQLAAEEPDVPPDSVDDRWRGGPAPKSPPLVDEGRLTAEEGEADRFAAPEDSAVHVVSEEQDREQELSDADEGETLEEAEDYTDLDQARDVRGNDRRE